MDYFERYSDSYDQLYEDKDYQKECKFIKDVFEIYGTKKITSILDLGCGTGSHALIFTDMGYEVTGVDLSESMLGIAQKKSAEKKKGVKFIKQDIRNLDLHQQFDSAVAMFAVMGYQTSNKDFEDTLISVYRHLLPGGLFIFDVWFGPAVLMEKPQDRIKEINSHDKKIIRYAYPILDIVNQTVEVNYTILEIIEDKKVTETKENHLIRYFFYQELKYMLEKSGFQTLNICSAMDLAGVPNRYCWNISIITKKHKVLEK